MPPSLPYTDALPTGACNSISDVADVIVGHATVTDDDIQTGMTVIRPHTGDPFVDKVPAVSAILNGFSKSIGLVQVDKLGALGTPITLTSTFATGAVAQTQIRQMAAANPQIGHAWSAVNPLVSEYNDGCLGDLQTFVVQEVHYDAAHTAVAQTFEQGVVGAGHGMSSPGMKGGIGFALRVITLADGAQRTVGVFVLSNLGVTKSLVLGGRSTGAELASAFATATPEPEKGSIIILVATDAPLDACQLRHLILYASAGLARTGSAFDHDSGNIALTSFAVYTVPHEGAHAIPVVSATHESHLGPLFQAAANGVEQAIVYMLFHVTVIIGRDGNTCHALTKLL